MNSYLRKVTKHTAYSEGRQR